MICSPKQRRWGFSVYLRPFQDKALSLLGLSRRFQEVATRSWEIAPAQTKPASPALYDPAELDHVQGTWSGTTIAAEVDKLVSPVQSHAATRGFLLKNVDVVDGYLYGRRWKLRLMPVRPPVWAAAPEVRMAHGTLACTWSGNMWFGHWVTDDLTLYLAAAEVGAPFTLERKPYQHEPQYRELLDIPDAPLRRAHFDEMIVLEDFAQNDYKRRRYELLRSRLRAHLPRRGSDYVFLRRGSSGERRSLVNSVEVESFLSSQGFAIVDPEALQPVEVAARLLHARVVLSVEGSHLAHALLAASQGAILCCIQPPGRFNNIYRGHTECLNMGYAIIVARPSESGFRVELDSIKRILDRIGATLSVPAQRAG